MAFNWDEGASSAIHGAADWKEKQPKHKYMDCLLAHRMGVDNIYRGTPPKAEDVKYAVERGSGQLQPFQRRLAGACYSDAQVDAVLKRIDAVWKEYEAEGITDRAYIFGFDEHYQEAAIPQIYGAIGKRFPQLKRLVLPETVAKKNPVTSITRVATMPASTFPEK